MTGDSGLSEIASAHALTTMKALIRDDHSTFHVANFDQQTGLVKQRMTNQGYSDDSCWARGQAWGVTGFAQCYRRTKDKRFLETSIGLADYFITRLPEDSVPHWDFDAPQPAPRDTSAGLIAAYGMLLIHEALEEDTYYLAAALRIVSGVLRTSMSSEARFVKSSSGAEDVDLGGCDTILLHATINNYEFAPRRWADHGLVYADYYFLLIGNKLLDMGILGT